MRRARAVARSIGSRTIEAVTVLCCCVVPWIQFAHAQEADEVERRSTAGSFELPEALPDGFDPAAVSHGEWRIEWSELLYPVEIDGSATGVRCFVLGNRDHGGIGWGLQEPSESAGLFARTTGVANCGADWTHGSAPAFHVYAAVSRSWRDELGGAAQFRISMSREGDALASEKPLLDQLAWTLEARAGNGSWQTVARVSPGRQIGIAGWIRDPVNPSVPALVLADDEADPSAAPEVAEIATAPNERRPARLAADALDHGFDSHRDPSALHAAAIDRSRVPVIGWRSGESVDRLRLEIVDTLETRDGGNYYCVRPMYDRDGQRRALVPGDAPDTWAIGDRPPAADPGECGIGNATGQLTFPVYVIGPVLRGDARLTVRGKSGASSLSLADAEISLESKGRSLVTSGADDWFRATDGSPALLLLDDGFRSGPLAIRYTSLPTGTDGPLQIDGRSWAEGEQRPTDGAPVTVTWTGATGTPSRAVLCSDEACEASRRFAELPVTGSAITFDPNDVVLANGNVVTVGIDWSTGESEPAGTSPGGSAALAAASGHARDDLVFAPSVSFGDYRRPLTSCLGRLIGDGWESEPFALRLGRQVLDVAGLPDGVDERTPLRVSFDRSRDGGDCPVRGLSTSELTVAALRERSSGGEVEMDVPVDAPLFVGYLQLNAAPYRASLARWKNALEFYDRVYREGRESGRWADGVLFGAGERGGLAPSVEPESNFVTALADASGLRAVARAERDDARVARRFFDEQLAALGELFGEQPVSLMYYDDLASDCDGYADAVAYGDLPAARIAVLAGIRGYTAADGATRSLPGELAHVCSESERLVVYAFNWEERADNEDFKLMLDTVLEDLDPTRRSVQ